MSVSYPARFTFLAFLLIRERFDGIPCIDPSVKAAEDGSDIGISMSEHQERRTGAGMFILSGAVGDDPMVFGEAQFCGIRFELSELDIDRTRDVTGRECIFASYIYKDG